MRTTMLTVTVLAVLCASASISAQEPGAAQPDVIVSSEAATLQNRHADLAAQLDRNQLQKMQQVWHVPTDHPVSHTPLIADGRVYTADWGGHVYAIDAENGTVVWQAKVEEPKMNWPWHGFAGTGVLGGGLLFEASVEGNAFALDPDTGEIVWQSRIAEDTEAGSLARLTYHDGLVFIGLQSVEEPLTAQMPNFVPDFRGAVLALDAETGETVWRTQLVSEPHNGVAVWSAFALDPELGVLYFTTGNNYTGEATELSDSIVAVNAATGEILWARQVTEHDVWTMADQEGPDYDFAGGPQLFEATIDGQPRRLVGAGQKSGVFYVWDRETGAPVWSTTIGYGGVDGGMHGEASIGFDRIIAWSNNNYLHTMPPGEAPVNIKALDPATGRHLWVKNKAQPALLFAAGYLTGDVYFLPSLDGRIRAYDAATGEQLWQSEAIGPIISSVVSAGDQLYAVAGAPKLFGDWADGPSGVFAFGTEPQTSQSQ